MIGRKVILAVSVLVLGAAPALAGGGASYHERQAHSPFYVGAVVGYGWGRLSVGGGSVKSRGVMGGGVIGYRVYSGDGALSIEGDILGANIEREKIETDYERNGNYDKFENRISSDILASLRVKGSLIYGAWQPYLTGGIAWQRFTHKFSNEEKYNGDVGYVSVSNADNQFGFTLGTGIDWQPNETFSLSLGYHYYRFTGELKGHDISGETQSDGRYRLSVEPNGKVVDTTTNLHTIRLSGMFHF